MNREVKTIQRERRPHLKDNDPINENNINIDINFADKEKEHLREMIQQYIPMIVEEPIEDIEEETDDDIEMDNLINDLENTIKEFMTFKEALIQRNINIPDNLLEIPDIEIKEKQDIINLIVILKNRIEEFKNLLRIGQIKPQQRQPLTPQTPINPLTQPTPLRARKEFMPTMPPSRVRPSFYGDDNTEDARREVNDTKKFISNRDIYNSNNIELINRAILRLNRNTKHVDTLLLDQTNSQRENRMLRDLHKQIQSMLNRLENKKLDLTGQSRPPPADEPAPADTPAPAPAPADEPADDEPADDEPADDEPAPIGEDEIRPIPEEDEPVPRIPQKTMGKSDESFILELQNWLMRYESRATRPQLTRARKRMVEAQDRLRGQEGDDQIPEDEQLDILQNMVDERIEELRRYNNLITSSGRSQNNVGVIRNRVNELLNNILRYRHDPNTSNDDLKNFIENRNLIMDRSGGIFPTALAFENLSGEIRDRDRHLDLTDVITLEPIDMTDTRKTAPRAKQIFYLYKNGSRIVSSNQSLNSTERELRSRFTEDGDIYSSSDLDQFIEEEPAPEEPIQETPPIEEVNQRDLELLNYRNELFYTPYNQDIVNSLDEQIGLTMGTDNLIILDRTNNNLPATIAYLHLPVKRIIEENIESAELRVQPRTLLPDENSNDAYLLYINGVRQDNEYNQQMLFNVYGDEYSIDDQMGRTPITSYPFRPAGRQDLSAPEPETEPNPPSSTPDFDPDEYDESIGMIHGRDPNAPIPPPPTPSPPAEQTEPHSSRRPIDYSAIYGSRANTGQIRNIQQHGTSIWDAMKNVLGFGDHDPESGSLTQITLPEQQP